MLGMFVFLWGLGYKLSQYEVRGPSVHRIPEAKLLSPDEDPNATDGLRHCVSHFSKPAGLVFMAATIVFWRNVEVPSQNVVHRDLELKQPAGSRLRAGLNAFFFRPPPGL